MKRLIFTLVICIPYMLIGQSHEETEINNRILTNQRFIKDNKIPIRNLFKVDQSIVKINCDSNLLYKIISNDTIILNSFGTEVALDQNEFKEAIADNEIGFGEYSYLNGLTYDGKFLFKTLKSYTFKVENDSLYELQDYYKISPDSISELEDRAWLGTKDQNERKDLLNIISLNRYYKFKLIYCKNMFTKSSRRYFNPISKDEVYLSGYWKTKNNKYYLITIKTKSPGGTNFSYQYRFDMNYRFIDLDECDAIEIDNLKNTKSLKFYYED